MYALVHENKVFGRDLALRHGTVVCLDPGVSTRKNTSLQTGSRGGRKNSASAKQKNCESEVIGARQGSSLASFGLTGRLFAG